MFGKGRHGTDIASWLSPWLGVFTIVEGMSALPLKADIAECDGDVRFVPEADIQILTRTHFASGAAHRLHYVRASLPGRQWTSADKVHPERNQSATSMRVSRD